MAIPVKLQVFEGPLDLLLHLIDINKIDIYDIPISLITDQYLAYIHTLKQQDMDVMSEFLVMAAILLKIKSKMLLPQDEEEKESEAEGDPRAELVERLLEYKMYKYAAAELKERQTDASRAVFKDTTLPADMVYEEPPVDLDALVGDMDIQKLYQIFKTVMKRQSDKIDPIRSKYGKIVQEEINLTDKIMEMERLGRNFGRLSFKALLKQHPTKLNAVVTFLAVLELMKSGKIKVHQEALFEDMDIVFAASDSPKEHEKEQTDDGQSGGYDEY